jgi:integrase
MRLKASTPGRPKSSRSSRSTAAWHQSLSCACALLLYTGTRRGDMVTLGRQHVRDGWLRFVPSKSRKQTKTVVLSEKPWLPILDQIVKASPCGDLTFLVTEYGKPFTAAGFGGWFRDRCDEAGLPRCSAHGLRKMGGDKGCRERRH